ncbi:spore-associated protein A [Nonomuraea sp. KC401]|uniref:spore-associated protein A n=1 Tax=unclassified Nonomuraea TaxID=2593643 RepID=UPI0010FDB7FB|nr:MULTISPECIES: spore-associated protein A [unclassified Nonomuraea]NBE95807.1 spore-associated protein A [Nonomuraea sp. K271]TLF71305.1 spore-associated protein A [Nonomuraea sp. KC401]
MKQGMWRMVLGLGGSLLLGAGLMVGTAAPATAAGCSGTHLDNWSITGGYIAVYYNSSTGKNCAMTYTNKPGTKQYIRVDISASGGGSQTDRGSYTTYAGPVSVSAKGKCISFAGQVGSGRPLEGVTDVYCD